MSHNTRTRVDVTDWGDVTRAVSPAEMDKLDQQAFQSINGDLGGEWAPVTPINIGGAGMVVTGLLWIQGVSGLLSYAPAQFENTVQMFQTLDVLGTITGHAGAHISGGTFLVDSPATFNGIADFFDDVTFHTSAFVQIGGDSQIGNDSSKTLDVEATSTFNGAATFNSEADFFENVTFHTSGLVTVGGHAVLGNDATKSLQVNASSFFDGPATLNGTLDCWDDVTLHTAVTLNVNGAANFNGAMALGDTSGDPIDVPGTMNLHTALTYSFSGRVPLRATIAPDSDKIYASTDANVVHVVTVEHAGQFTISDTNGRDGDVFEFSMDKSIALGETVDIRSPAGFLCTLERLSNNFLPSCKVVRIGGVWRLTQGVNVSFS